MIQKISVENLEILDKFISKIGKSRLTFRYFDKRIPKEAIKTHLFTIVLLDSANGRYKSPVAYGHLDKEGEKVWLGVCVIDSCIGKGYGNIIMKELLNFYDGEIYLSVDEDNIKAINMYKKNKFTNVEINIPSRKGLIFMVRK